MAAGRGEEWYSSAAAGSREGMERNVARLFQERGPIFGEVSHRPACSQVHMPFLHMPS